MHLKFRADPLQVAGQVKRLLSFTFAKAKLASGCTLPSGSILTGHERKSSSTRNHLDLSQSRDLNESGNILFDFSAPLRSRVKFNLRPDRSQHWSLHGSKSEITTTSYRPTLLSDLDWTDNSCNYATSVQPTSILRGFPMPVMSFTRPRSWWAVLCDDSKKCCDDLSTIVSNFRKTTRSNHHGYVSQSDLSSQYRLFRPKFA